MKFLSIELSAVLFTAVMVLMSAVHPAEPEDIPPPPEPPAGATPDAGNKELSVEDVLAETLTDEDYGDVTRCIDMGRINDSKILDRQHVAFKVSGRRIYIVKLIMPCRSLDYDDVLSLHSSSGRLCRLDSIHTIDRASGIPGVPCQIDSFRQVSKAQYDFLRAELKKHRDR